MTHSAFNGWFPFRKGTCQMISPFWDIVLVSIEWWRFCWKIVMCQRRLLSYEYITQKFFLKDAQSVRNLIFFVGPKDTVHPVYFFLASIDRKRSFVVYWLEIRSSNPTLNGQILANFLRILSKYCADALKHNIKDINKVILHAKFQIDCFETVENRSDA